MPKIFADRRNAVGSALALVAFIVAGLGAIADLPFVLMAVVDPDEIGSTQLGGGSLRDLQDSVPGVGIPAALTGIRVQGILVAVAGTLTLWGAVRILRGRLSGRRLMLPATALLAAAIVWNLATMPALATDLNREWSASDMFSYNPELLGLFAFGLLPVLLVANPAVSHAVRLSVQRSTAGPSSPSDNTTVLRKAAVRHTVPADGQQPGPTARDAAATTAATTTGTVIFRPLVENLEKERHGRVLVRYRITDRGDHVEWSDGKTTSRWLLPDQAGNGADYAVMTTVVLGELFSPLAPDGVSAYHVLFTDASGTVLGRLTNGIMPEIPYSLFAAIPHAAFDPLVQRGVTVVLEKVTSAKEFLRDHPDPSAPRMSLFELRRRKT